MRPIFIRFHARRAKHLAFVFVGSPCYGSVLVEPCLGCCPFFWSWLCFFFLFWFTCSFLVYPFAVSLDYRLVPLGQSPCGVVSIVDPLALPASPLSIGPRRLHAFRSALACSFSVSLSPNTQTYKTAIRAPCLDNAERRDVDPEAQNTEQPNRTPMMLAQPARPIAVHPQDSLLPQRLCGSRTHPPIPLPRASNPCLGGTRRRHLPLQFSVCAW